MKSLIKHSNINNIVAVAFILTIFLMIGCSKQEKTEKSVVKVNKSVLTEDDVKSALSEEHNNGIYREEYIRSWIETEILFQQAVDNGILEGKEFKSLTERNKKELAAALFIKQILNENNVEPSEDEIKKYYEANKEEFKLTDDAYRINEIQFNDFDKAVKFRNNLVETDWIRAINVFRSEQSVVLSASQKIIYKYQIQPSSLIRIMSNLEPNEVSVVIEIRPKIYTVIQLVEKFNKDVIPQYELVRSEVKDRLLVINNKEYLKKYIDKLISDHNLEIERYSE